MTRRLLGAALAATFVGCGFLPTGPTVVTLHTADGAYELPVALYDPGGLVTTVAAAEPDTTGPSESQTVVDDAAAVLQWLGGACDTRSQINVLAHDKRISVAVRTDEGFGSCTAIGIPRAVTITFREPIGDRVLELAGRG